MRSAILSLTAIVATIWLPAAQGNARGHIGRSDAPLALTLSKEVDADGHLYALVRMRNQSDHPICIDRDILENDASWALHLDLRRRSHRPIAFGNPGYVPAPLEGVVTLQPGAEVTARTVVSIRFVVAERELVAARDLEMSAEFTARACAGAAKYRITTGWRPFQ